MTRRRALSNRILLAAPWLAGACMVAMSQALPNRAERGPESQQRKAQVAAAMNAVPLFIGRWVGQDEQVPPEAQKMLHPNAVLSRSYYAPDTPAMHVLVVHCGDARDMIGHYPPICYPSSGWLPARVDASEIALQFNGMTLPTRQYAFQRFGDSGAETASIRVFNTFIVPDGHITPNIHDIHRQSERLALSVQGVAQLQVITSGLMPLDDAVAAADELLGGMANLFDALGVEVSLDQ